MNKKDFEADLQNKLGEIIKQMQKEYDLNSTSELLKLSPLEKQTINVIHDLVNDLCPELEATITKCRYHINNPDGMCVTIVPDIFNVFQSKQGIHTVMDEDLDEHKLADLIEDAVRDGFDRIYIHKAA